MTADDFSKEVVRLHEFFEGWFTGGGDLRIEEFSDSLDESFCIVTPTGSILPKESIVDHVERHHASGPMRIWIDDVRLHLDDGAVILGSYKEHQQRGDVATVRVSSAGLRRKPESPGGFHWLFVHETWVGEPGS